MGPILQFVIALVIAGSSLAGGSLIWPRVSQSERPKLLQTVHDSVLRTQPGQRAAEVLGVSDESNVEPLRPGEIIGNVINGIRQSAEDRIRIIVVGNAVNELSRQFDRLSTDQKKYVQEALCKPPENP